MPSQALAVWAVDVGNMRYERILLVRQKLNVAASWMRQDETENLFCDITND